MKTLLPIVAIIFSTTILAQTTAIPDPNFEQVLINLGYDTGSPDGSVPTANINTVTFLVAVNSNISDLTGIQDFTALTALACASNQLTNLNVSQNSTLTVLSCENNQITNLDLSQNTSLTDLNCNNNQLTSLNITGLNSLVTVFAEDNQLTSLDITQNASLEEIDVLNSSLTNLIISSTPSLLILECRGNQLTSFDATSNTSLTILDLAENQITSTIDVTQNTNLLEFYCQDNQLTSINVTQNTALTNFACFNNQITSLDISNNPNLVEFGCHNNQIICLNAKSGNNTILAVFFALGNPNLTCIQVDNVAFSTTNWTDINAIASFSTSCGNSCTVGIDELSINHLSTYPNPTEGSVTIDLKNKKAAIKVYDIMGKIVFAKNNVNNQVIIDLSNQPNGIYLANIIVDGKIYNERIVKK